jgi:hypothetical protein
LAFLVKRPFIYVIVIVVAFVVLLQLSGVLYPKPLGLEITEATLGTDTIKLGENTTLTVTVVNRGVEPQTAELRLMTHAINYSSTEISLQFYDAVTGEFLPWELEEGNYTATYPTTRIMGSQESWGIPITIENVDPWTFTYTLFIEVYAVNEQTTTRTYETSVQVTVTRE